MKKTKTHLPLAEKEVNLKKIRGTKIRWQFFNLPIYFLLSFIPVFPIIDIIISLQENNLNFAETIEGLEIISTLFLVLILPLVFLSLLNRYLFGSIVGVITDEGLYLDNGLVEWEKIEKIEYNPKVMIKYTTPHADFTYAIIRIKTTKHPIEVLHFPLYAVRKIKKQNPEIKVSLGKNGLVTVLLVALAPTVLAAIAPLLS